MGIKFPVKKTIKTIFKIFCFWLLFFLVVFLMSPFLLANKKYKLVPEEFILLLAAIITTVSFIRVEGLSVSDVGLELNKKWIIESVFGGVAGCILMLIVSFIIYFINGVEWKLNYTFNVINLLNGTWLFILVAIGEELLNRGYPFQIMSREVSFGFAQVVFSIVFALLHWNNPGMIGITKIIATINIALAAMFLGLTWYYSRSLAFPIGFHFGWNFFQGTVLGFGVSGNKVEGMLIPIFKNKSIWISGGDFGPEASLFCSLVMSFSIMAVWLMCRYKYKHVDNRP